MIEIRACTPDDAAAVSTLLSELGYTVPIRQATENVQELGKTGADPIFVAVADGGIVRKGIPSHEQVMVAVMAFFGIAMGPMALSDAAKWAAEYANRHNRGMDSNYRFPVAKAMNPIREPEPSRRRQKSVSKR
jgi:hypothetical protein